MSVRLFYLHYLILLVYLVHDQNHARLNTRCKTELKLDRMNTGMNESWTRKWKRVVSYPRWHRYTFVIQIGTFNIRMWAWSHLIGSFAGHWTREIINKYWSINELDSFSQKSSRAKTVKSKLCSQNNPRTLGHQKSTLFSITKHTSWAIVVTARHLWHPPNWSHIY